MQHYIGKQTQKLVYNDDETGLVGPDAIAAVSKTYANSWLRGAVPRKSMQSRRYRLLKSMHARDIVGRVEGLFRSPEVTAGIEAHISVSINPAADIVSALCQVWKNGAVRRISGASELEKEAFMDLVSESRIATLAPEWNRLAYFVGPIVVFPRMKRGKLRFETVLPHDVDLILDPLDPLGDPIGAAFTPQGRSDADFVVVDAFAWRYYKAEADGPKLLSSEPHSLGRFPGVVLDFETPLEPADRYCEGRHQRMVDGGLDVGRIYASLGFVRRTQNKKLLTIFGQLNAIAEGQDLGDPEMPIEGNLPEGADAVQLDVHDFDTDPINFMKEIRFAIENMAESTGVPVSISSSGNGGDFDMEFDHTKLTELRKQQILYAREFERDLWALSIDVARAGRHRLTIDLPSSDMVREGFSAEFGQISREYSDPRVRMDDWEFRFRHGAATKIDLLREEHPFLNDEQLRELLEANLEETTMWNDALTKRNLSADADDSSIQTASEAFGAMGPVIRDSGDE